MTQEVSVPTISELYADNIEEAFKNEKLNSLLNQPPKESWIKVHPQITGHKYVPIDKVEFMLRKIFKRFRIEVLKTGMLLNSVEVTVRVHYWNPVTNDWDFHDGTGACEVQTKKDSGALKLDMSNINRGAIPMALPIAKSQAIKDACDHLGKLFGCDLNRKDTLPFNEDKNIAKAAVDAEILEQMNLITDLPSLDKYVLQLVTDFPKLNHNLAFRDLVEKTKQRIKPKP